MTVEILRQGEAAVSWNAVEAFRTFEGERTKRIEEEKRKQNELLVKVSAGYDQTQSGLRYKIIQNGDGKQATKEPWFLYTTKVSY